MLSSSYHRICYTFLVYILELDIFLLCVYRLAYFVCMYVRAHPAHTFVHACACVHISQCDDDELNAELDVLEQEQIDSKLMDIPNIGPVVKVTPAANKSPAAKAPAVQKEIKFPEAPSTVPKKTETDEEKELRELQASMAM